jgi:hypothetical protein
VCRGEAGLALCYPHSTTSILSAITDGKYHPDFLSLACPAKQEGERSKVRVNI